MSLGDISKSEGLSEPVNLVYGEVEGSLVFIPRDQDQELAVIWAALGSSSTWGEFRSLLSSKRYDETLGLMADADDFDSFFARESQGRHGLTREDAFSEYREIEVGERLPLDDDPFPGYDLPWVADGDYPEWCAQEMLKWVPPEMINQPYSTIEDSVHNGQFLVLDPMREGEIITAFGAAGFRCAKDQRLVSRATGHGSLADAEESVPELILALMSGNDQVRSSAIEELEEIGEPATSALIEALKHPNEAIRSGAARTLGGVRPVYQVTITALIDALSDESENVRHCADSALRSLGPEASSALPALIEALHHSSATVRAGACGALEGIGPQASLAVPVLIEAVRDPATHWQAMQALGRIVPNFARSLMSDSGPFHEVLEGDDFVNHACVRCGSHGALFATPRMFSACPKCLAERIRNLRARGGELPVWLHYLEVVSEQAAIQQAKAEEVVLGVSFDDFSRCGRCGKLIPEKEVRAYYPPGINSSPPYCVECYQRLRRGE